MLVVEPGVAVDSLLGSVWPMITSGNRQVYEIKLSLNQTISFKTVCSWKER
jgi:hypothetical protein